MKIRVRSLPWIFSIRTTTEQPFHPSIPTQNGWTKSSFEDLNLEVNEAEKRRGIDADSKGDFESAHDQFEQGNSTGVSKKIFDFNPNSQRDEMMQI